MAQSKYYVLHDKLPKGWKVDKNKKSQLKGYSFCSNDKGEVGMIADK